MTRRRFLCHGAAAFALPGLLAGRFARAETLLETLRIMIGFTAGGSADILARRVAQALRGGYARTVLVDNRAGAGGQLAVLAAKAAPADGATLLLTPSSMLTLFPHTYRQLQYDPLKDVAPVSLACTFELVLVIGPMVDASVTTLADFLAWARAHPEAASFGSPAAGSSSHFVGAMLSRAEGIELNHVPYRGMQPAIFDLTGGQLAAACGPIGDVLPHVAGGHLRLLAVSGARRSRFLPNVPTFVEHGYKDIIADGWFAFYLPAGASRAVAQRANAALRGALAREDIVQELAQMGFEAASSSEAELDALQRRDSERWSRIVKAIGFSAL